MKTNFYLGNKQRFTAQNEMFQQSCCIVHDDTIGQNALDHHSECLHSKQPISWPWTNQQVKLNYLCYVEMSFPTSQASNERPSRCWLQDEFQVPTFINPWNHSELRRQPTQVYHQDCYGVCYNLQHDQLDGILGLICLSYQDHTWVAEALVSLHPMPFFLLLMTGNVSCVVPMITETETSCTWK